VPMQRTIHQWILNNLHVYRLKNRVPHVRATTILLGLHHRDHSLLWKKSVIQIFWTSVLGRTIHCSIQISMVILALNKFQPSPQASDPAQNKVLPMDLAHPLHPQMKRNLTKQKGILQIRIGPFPSWMRVVSWAILQCPQTMKPNRGSERGKVDGTPAQEVSFLRLCVYYNAWNMLRAPASSSVSLTAVTAAQSQLSTLQSDAIRAAQAAQALQLARHAQQSFSGEKNQTMPFRFFETKMLKIPCGRNQQRWVPIL
jgi:hypothetical protein